MFLKIFLFFFTLGNIYVHGTRGNRKNPKGNAIETVKIELLYESQCPYSINFYTKWWKSIVLELGQHLDVNTYPYGNAKTEIDENGHISITCQHGVKECYGNMIHACAIDCLKNITNAVIFNSCLMNNNISNGDSDDAAADKCGQIYGVNSKSLKDCAKSNKGLQLLKHYGDISSEYKYLGVPWILINGERYDSAYSLLKMNICRKFKNRPPECKK